MRLLCPAKINLHLRVGRRRADGFHPLLSWMTTVGLFDTLTVEMLQPPAQGGASAGGNRTRATRPVQSSGPAQADDGPPPGRERAGAARILLLSSDLPGLPVDESNLVVRAAEAFAASIAGSGAGDVDERAAAGPSGRAGQAGAKSSSVALQQSDTERTLGAGEGAQAVAAAGHQPARVGGEPTRVRPVNAMLEKQIPLGAGLGGGSSDAARTLVALNRLWQVDWPVARLAELAAQLGSDVSFFLHGPSSICTGRGEIVQPVPQPLGARWAVIVLPDIHMSTAAVYQRFDEMGLGFDGEIGQVEQWEQWAALSAKDLLPRLVNDLEAAAFQIRPDLGTLQADLELILERPVRMSGSGSSLFTLYGDEAEAKSAAASTSSRYALRAVAVEMTPDVRDDLDRRHLK